LFPSGAPNAKLDTNATRKNAPANNHPSIIRCLSVRIPEPRLGMKLVVIAPLQVLALEIVKDIVI
jgi:hypothetical protein